MEMYESRKYDQIPQRPSPFMNLPQHLSYGNPNAIPGSNQPINPSMMLPNPALSSNMIIPNPYAPNPSIIQPNIPSNPNINLNPNLSNNPNIPNMQNSLSKEEISKKEAEIISQVNEMFKEKVRLYEDKKEKDEIENMSEIYSILVAADRLEWALLKDFIDEVEYEKQCYALINKFKTLQSRLNLKNEDIFKFAEDMDLDIKSVVDPLIIKGHPTTIGFFF